MQNMLGMCFNWKVLVGLAAVGIGVFVFAPGWGLVILPLLILAACPLSMLVMALMMGRMGKMGHNSDMGHETTGGRSPEALRAQLNELRREEARLEGELKEADARPASSNNAQATLE